MYEYAMETLSLLLHVEFHDAIHEENGKCVMKVWKLLLLVFKASNIASRPLRHNTMYYFLSD